MADHVEQVIILDYNDLVKDETSPELMKLIEQAYGYDGLGILAVKNIPNFADKRARGLPMSYKFGNLSEAVKSKYEHPESFYSFGWSHGKEKLEGKPDYAKGSFYANPVHDTPVDDKELIEKYPSFCHPNIWPSEEDCPGFEAAFKDLAKLIVDAGALLARHCDNYVRSQQPTYGQHADDKDGKTSTEMNKVINYGRTHKARLLYYFSADSVTETEAKEKMAEDPVSSWCGWHNDHGSLTGLTPAMFFDKEGNAIPCPDPEAGLYIRSRSGKTVRVTVPSDHLAFQIGETAQIHTGGILQATPHCVRAATNTPHVSRGTLAVFMEPEWSGVMRTPEGADPEHVFRGARGELLPKGVPPLVNRWTRNGMTFSEFTDATLGSYY